MRRGKSYWDNNERLRGAVARHVTCDRDVLANASRRYLFRWCYAGLYVRRSSHRYLDSYPPTFECQHVLGLNRKVHSVHACSLTSRCSRIREMVSHQLSAPSVPIEKLELQQQLLRCSLVLLLSLCVHQRPKGKVAERGLCAQLV